MNFKIILLIAALISVAYSAPSACTPPAGRCCCDGDAGDDPAFSSGQAASCVAAAASCTATAQADLPAATCATLYYLSSGTCTACPIGFTSTAGNSDTSCTPCPQNEVAAAAVATACTGTAQTGTPSGWNAIGCRVFGQAGATTCIVAKNGFKVTSGNAVPCDENQYSLNGGACTNLAAGDLTAQNAVAALANCHSFSVSNPTTIAHCASAQATYGILGGSGAGTAINKCIDGCDVCTGLATATAPDCLQASSGQLLKGAGTATQTIEACDQGCSTCAWQSGTTPAESTKQCSAVKPGYTLSATFVIAKCPPGQGSAGGTVTACEDCDAAVQFCGNCLAKDDCTSCKAGYTFNATPAAGAAKCTLFEVAQQHFSCKTASAEGDAGCNECDGTANFRSIETEIVAPATTATNQAVGKCLCMSGYTEQKVPVAACVACPANVSKCTETADGVFTVTECNANFYKAGNGCYAQTDAVTGFFWNTVPTTSKFEACHASCKTCNGNAATNCVTCPDRPTTFVAPTESDANYAAYLKAITQINNTCFSDCPTGWTANEEKTNCVEGSAGSASGIFSVILLIASLFMLI